MIAMGQDHQTLKAIAHGDAQMTIHQVSKKSQSGTQGHPQKIGSRSEYLNVSKRLTVKYQSHFIKLIVQMKMETPMVLKPSYGAISTLGIQSGMIRRITPTMKDIIGRKFHPKAANTG
jgi:hypothetical protein